MGHVNLKITIGAGGADVGFVTAGAAQILSPYIGSDTEGKPITGTIPTSGNSGKTISPTEKSAQTAISAGQYASGAINVGAISNTYVGSGVTRQGAKTVTPSESTQTAVASGVYTTGAVSVGAISKTYVGSGVTKQAAKTVTPSTSSQTAVASGVYTTGAITVGAIPNQKTDSGNVTLTGSTTSKSYAAGYYANAHGAAITTYSGAVS